MISDYLDDVSLALEVSVLAAEGVGAVAVVCGAGVAVRDHTEREDA